MKRSVKRLLAKKGHENWGKKGRFDSRYKNKKNMG